MCPPRSSSELNDHHPTLNHHFTHTLRKNKISFFVDSQGSIMYFIKVVLNVSLSHPLTAMSFSFSLCIIEFHPTVFLYALLYFFSPSNFGFFLPLTNPFFSSKDEMGVQLKDILQNDNAPPYTQIIMFLVFLEASEVVWRFPFRLA